MRLLTGEAGVKAKRKVKMYGAQNMYSQTFRVRTRMRLRGKKFDTLKFTATGTNFSDFVALLSAGAIQQSRRGVRVQKSLKHQGNLLYGKCEALTIRPSGPANTPLRSVPAVH
jgi:hypothetical protein